VSSDSAPEVSRAERGLQTITDRMAELASQNPDAPALALGDTQLTRTQLLSRSSNIASYLHETWSIGPGSRVAVGLGTGIEQVQVWFAAWRIGATVVNLPHRLADHEFDAIVEMAEPDVVIGAASARASRVRTVPAEQLHEAAVRSPWRPPPVRTSNPWRVMTSGGSTGRPKLIAADQPALAAPLLAQAPVVHMAPGGAVLVPAPLSHSGPMNAVLTGLLVGNNVVLTPRFDASMVLDLVARHRVTWLYQVPTMMNRIWKLPASQRDGADLSSLQTLCHMAAPCPAWLKRAYIDWLGPHRVRELYGSTEGIAMTIIGGEEWLTHPGSVGRPVIGEFQCRDQDGIPVPAGQEGELWVRRDGGEPMPYRYIGAAPRMSPDGWQSIGDHGRIDPDGYVYITDRETDMILVGGSNLYPAELESALDEHPQVLSSCVVGVPDDDLGRRPHALVQCASPLTEDELLNFLRTRVAAWKLPRSFEFVDRPLRDDSGKVRRPEIAARVAGISPTSTALQPQESSMSIRRVVTGHDAAGRSVLVSDTSFEPVAPRFLGGGRQYLLWASDVPPSIPPAPESAYRLPYFPPVGGARFYVITAPGQASGSTSRSDGPADDPQALLEELDRELPGLSDFFEPDDPGMHVTPTVDCIVMLYGEVTLELDSGEETVLRGGDILIQNGTRHRWHNRTDQEAAFAVAIIGAATSRVSPP
jgi:bile acid-coenzyme A ligase